jgi:hypothetical protein
MRNEYLVGSSEKDRELNDFYATPPYATEALLERESFENWIWEPACGDGAISKVLKEYGYQVVSSDKVDRGYGFQDDFFDMAEMDLPYGREVKSIITNPPYKLAQEFIETALNTNAKKIAMLLKLNFLEGQKRYEFFYRTPLKRVYVFSKRLSFDKGNEKGKGNGLLAYAWYVWEQGYEGETTLEWIL